MPLSMKPFTEHDVWTILTEEDVPQKSLGGSRIILTCKDCNNTCESEIYIHLYNAIKVKEQRLFLPHTNRKISVEKDWQRLNAELQVEDNRNIRLLINTKRNNPCIWENFYNNVSSM